MKRLSMRRLLVIPALLLVITVNADTLVLRDGRRIDGQLIGIVNGVVEFQDVQPFTGGRTLRFNRDEIVGIEFNRNDRNPAQYSQPREIGRAHV